MPKFFVGESEQGYVVRDIVAHREVCFTTGDQAFADAVQISGLLNDQIEDLADKTDASFGESLIRLARYLLNHVDDSEAQRWGAWLHRKAETSLYVQHRAQKHRGGG